MAIIGFQFISTLIGASILSKIITKSTFIIGGLCKNLYKYVSPNDDIILELAGLSKVKSKGKKSKTADNNPDEFYFPRDTKIPLLGMKVTEYDISLLPMYSDLVWLVDFSFCALMVYLSNEAYNTLVPQKTNQSEDKLTKSILLKVLDTSQIRVNLSLVWLSIVIVYCLVSLKRIVSIFSTKPKNSSDSSVSPELFMVLSVSFMFFILNFFFLTFDNKFLDFKVHQLHASLSTSNATDPDNIKAIFTKEKIQIFLSLIGSLISGLFLFPGMRFGRMYLDSLKYSGILARIANTINFLSPIFILLLWFIPFTNYFIPISLSSASALASSSGFPFLMSPILALIKWTQLENLASFRVFVTLLYLSVRVLTVKVNLQAYLNIAKESTQKIQREPGKISNIEFRTMMSNLFCCFNLVATQYIAPLVTTFCLLSLYKNCSGLSWFPWTPVERMKAPPTPGPEWDEAINSLTGLGSESYLDTVIFTRNYIYTILDSMKLQGHLMSECFLGYALWSSIMSWQLISIVGVLYYQYAD